MPQIFGRPLWSFLPFGSLEYYDRHGPDNPILEKIHISYGFLGVITILSYIVISSYTLTLNPLKQIQIQRYIRKDFDKDERKRDALYDEIFGPNGFADTNFDKKVDIVERAYALKKLGLEDFPVQGLTLEQLEELVKKYHK